MTRPTASGELAAKFEAVIPKMQEPKDEVPVAVETPEAMANAGEPAVLVNAKVVGVVVPKLGTPEAKLKGVLRTAGTIAAVSGCLRLAVAVKVCCGPLSEPPPQATRVAVINTANMNFEVFNMITILPSGLLQKFSLEENWPVVNQSLKFD